MRRALTAEFSQYGPRILGVIALTVMHSAACSLFTSPPSLDADRPSRADTEREQPEATPSVAQQPLNDPDASESTLDATSAPRVSDDSDASVGYSTLVERTLAEIEAERALGQRTTMTRDAFVSRVRERFDRWASVLTDLSNADHREEADRLAQALASLRQDWSDELFPRSHYDSFVRERARLGEHRIEAAQFFEPTPFEPGGERLVMLFRFSIYSEQDVIRRYFLERRELLGAVYHALSAVESEHQQSRDIEQFDDRSPGYWHIREAVLADLRARPPRATADSSGELSPNTAQRSTP
jgi:hypothetical protein